MYLHCKLTADSFVALLLYRYHCTYLVVFYQSYRSPFQNDQNPFQSFVSASFGPLKDMFRCLDAVAREECARPLADFIEALLPHANDDDVGQFDFSDDGNKTPEDDGMRAPRGIRKLSFMSYDAEFSCVLCVRVFRRWFVMFEGRLFPFSCICCWPFAWFGYRYVVVSAERAYRAKLPASSRNQVLEMFDLMSDLFEVCMCCSNKSVAEIFLFCHYTFDMVSTSFIINFLVINIVVRCMIRADGWRESGQ
jgi:hypothetical protein